MTTIPPSDANEVLASRTPQNLELAAAASEVVQHMLGDGRSVIDPDVVIWTAEAAEDLRARIEDNPLEGSNMGQWAKLDLQLADAPRAVVLMCAELVYLRELPLFSTLPATRSAHVKGVLKHCSPEPPIPASMAAAMDRPTGVAGFNPGMGFNGALWRHLIWAATFVRHWTTLPMEQREAARQDPWLTQQEMLASGPDRPDMRNALQFLICPDMFEPISSNQMKIRIQQGLAERIGGTSGTSPEALDKDLLAIRASLAKDFHSPFHFWTPGIVELWDKEVSTPAEANDEPRQRHYWIYSPGEQASQWAEFSAKGIMGLSWDGLGDVGKYPSRAAVAAALAQAPDAHGKQTNSSLAVWEFQHEMAVGDVVYAKRGRTEIVGRGEVTSDARHEADRPAFRQVRSVVWTHVGSWPHPGDAVTKTLTDITRYGDYVDTLEALVTGDDDPQPVVPVVTIEPYDKDAFLSEVYLDEERYERLQGALVRKKNVILAGPPGVGKTFAAKRLAYSIMGEKDPDRVQMVQFHQSYSYEDFMMGYRPTETGGFVLTEGPFYRFCEAARLDADRPYFFIIDEINRGNISRIFGELLMLIESDKRGMGLRLLYKNETFTVPPNLHIIGMMNTADRSLAVLDYALRRRFAFFDMAPAFGSEGFQGWIGSAENPALTQLVDVVQQLNDAVANDPALGRGFAIGHSFLSRPSGELDEAWLFSVVEDELVPLLEEYWFDEPTRAAEWTGKLRDALA